MNLLKLAIAAKGVITGPGTWITGAREDEEGAHCTLGAIDEALGLKRKRAEQDPLGQKLIIEMGKELGITPEKALEAYCDDYYFDEDEDAPKKAPLEFYVEMCASEIISFNDDEGTQRKVQGLFQRVINKLQKKSAERRAKRAVKGILKRAIEGAKTAPKETIDAE